MRSRRLPLFALALVAASVGAIAAGTPASASALQDDMNACATAATDKGLIPRAGVRIRFVDDQGTRRRVLTVTAIDGEGDQTIVACRMNGHEVIAASRPAGD